MAEGGSRNVMESSSSKETTNKVFLVEKQDKHKHDRIKEQQEKIKKVEDEIDDLLKFAKKTISNKSI